jgi:PA domain
MADRGTCTFVQKARNAQAAGAVGLVLVNNLDDWPIFMTGKDGADISIPVILITLANGNTFKTALKASERISVELFTDPNTLAGADAQGRPMLFTPNPLRDGSTLNHWDYGAAPNQLMEWALERDLTQTVEPPGDLTLSLLRDLGWFSDFDGVPDGVDECPGSDRSSSVVIDYCDTGVRNVTFPNGCRISDYLKPCADKQGDSGNYAACVSSVATKMVDSSAIKPEESAKIQACVLPHQ